MSFLFELVERLDDLVSDETLTGDALANEFLECDEEKENDDEDGEENEDENENEGGVEDEVEDENKDDNSQDGDDNDKDGDNDDDSSYRCNESIVEDRDVSDFEGGGVDACADADQVFFFNELEIITISQALDLDKKKSVNKHIPMVEGCGNRFPPAYLRGTDTWKEDIENITHFQLLSLVEQVKMLSA